MCLFRNNGLKKLDYEHFKQTGEILTEEQQNYKYELSNLARWDFYAKLIYQLPNLDVVKSFVPSCVDSMIKLGTNINKNPMLYFVTKFNIADTKVITYKVSNLIIELIEKEKTDITKDCWYNPSLYVSELKNVYERERDICYRISAVALATNKECQEKAGITNYYTVDDIMKDGKFVRTADMRRFLENIE